jgi:hypothetical protein
MEIDAFLPVKIGKINGEGTFAEGLSAIYINCYFCLTLLYNYSLQAG